MKGKWVAATLCLALAGGIGSVPSHAEEGIALHYSDLLQGKRTANGDIFDQHAMTAAYKGLPFGSKVRVTNLDNGKSVVVTVNDRMSRHNRNVIDVTRRAAQELDFERQGKARVSIEPVAP